VKVGERDWAEDPKYAHYFVKGALTSKGKKSKRNEEKKKKKKSKKGPATSEEEEEETFGEEEQVENPDAQWIEVIVDEEGDTQSRRLLRPAASHEYLRVDKGATNVSFMKAFDHSRFSSGIVVLGPEGAKEAQFLRSDMVFYCLKGRVKIQLHETEFIAKKGDAFCAPNHNSYAIVNESTTKTAELVFFQSKM